MSFPVKIDKAWIKARKDVLNLYPEGTHAVFINGKNEGAYMLDADHFKELLRLAAIGLMVEK